ncbi:V-type proton ATPase subunit S1-like [Neocloeon triangulifer]|uniref:V-type proton ATPase subunit S1-like n=1 Tax=Neocloeon triangulifer TaxID=2078957 RepID=UPI00286F191B|nr:V-type proton ATPase subunit S1-like [Neocloeon triangulifer]
MLKFASVLVFIFAVSAAEYVPALVWQFGSEIDPVKIEPALHKYSTDKFKDLVTKLATNKDLVLVFAEENLSVEDFNWQDVYGQSSFPKLSDYSARPNTNFYSHVEDPFIALMDLQGAQWSDTKLDLDLPSKILSRKLSSQFVLVNMDDAADFEDRPNFLKRHDEIVSRALEAAKSSYDNVLAIYTGHHSSWTPEEMTIRRVRSLLQAEEPALNASRFINAGNLTYLYYSSPPNATLGDTSISLVNLLEARVEQEEDSPITLYLTYDHEGTNFTVIFPFAERTARYWNLDRISVQYGSDEYQLGSSEIYAPFGFSYHCSLDTTFSNKTTNDVTNSITFTDFQIEPQPPNVEETRFSDAYDCIPFFTMAIWSGILVSIILILFLTMGLMMILEIKVMDRFDDPKGKTITINAGE